MEIIHAIDGFLPMRWVEYDYKEVPISMDKYSIHERNILSMDLKYPWVPCNICRDLWWRIHYRPHFPINIKLTVWNYQTTSLGPVR